MLLMISAALMMVAAPDALAAIPAPSQEEENATEKMICKKEVVTGARSQRKRICMTQRQWERLANNARDDMNTTIDRALTYGTKSD